MLETDKVFAGSIPENYDRYMVPLIFEPYAADTGTVAIWLLNGLQVTQSGSLGVVAGNWTIAGTSDFNADGKGDILWYDASTGTVAIWLMNGLGILSTGSTIARTVFVHRIAGA